MDEKDFTNYKLVSTAGMNIFNMSIIDEIMNHPDVDHIDPVKVVNIGSIVRDMVLKEDHVSIGEAVDAVLLNYKDIIDNDLGAREIIRKYL
jgi:hypothetical protein